ncbi:BlaI/MecI/CopY family transcriptional regulator [Luteibacter sp. UNCMF366Tsu5.1]|uniref:BlaI/MecI/CopY family transcriptional regulator n=1 Tax=Luteibacter sp. UNCMF366Tsu5.1 TaxID=1502758 RepID=UPI0009088302|nr:BlaI/MecI/CopY family transcriptional regulator [Luteibacter sp. UNCMF366Tsu5.1]SFW70876.1 Predicted transcriptional regulator [Luteibacter sp. UNCMF366Tsu5.1]
MERVTESEQAILEALWEREPRTAAELAEKFEAERGWSISTVKTLLARLVAKEAILSEQDGRRFLYRAAVERDAYVVNQSRRLLDSLFGGRAAPLVAHLARNDALGADDIAELKKLLKDLKP